MESDLRLELYVDDIDRAVSSYTGVLGFEAGPSALRTYRPLERRGVRLALQSIDELGRDHPLVRGGRHATRGLGVEIVLEVDDLDAMHARLTKLGIDVTPLETRRWGLHNCRLLGPDGCYLRLTTPPLESTAAP